MTSLSTTATCFLQAGTFCQDKAKKSSFSSGGGGVTGYIALQKGVGIEGLFLKFNLTELRQYLKAVHTKLLS